MKKHHCNIFLSHLLQSGIIAAAAVGLAHTSQAATQTWKTAANGNWNDAASWTSIVPLVTDSAQFNATGANGPETVYLNGNQGASALTFANTGTTLLLGGASGAPANSVLALTGAITVNAGAGAVTIGDPAAKVDITTTSQTYNNNTNNLLTLANGISSSGTTGTQTLTIGNSNGVGTGGVTIGGPIVNGGTGGTMALKINAPKTTTTLLGTNAYTGVTLITQGKLTYGAASAPSVIQTVGQITGDAGADATVTSVQGNSGNSSLTFTTPNFTAGGTLNFVVSGGTNGVDNLIATTGGMGFVNKLAFFNGADYAYRNGVNTYMRAPVYGTDAGFGIAGSALVSAAHNLITASITGQAGISVNTLKFSGTGAVDLTQTASTIITFNNNSGILRSGGGATTISGGTITTGSNLAYVVRTDTASDSLTINSKLSNSGTNTFTKSGDGTATLGGANTFTGTTFCDAGSLNITGTSATSAYQANGSGVINLNNTNCATGTATITAQNCGTVNINTPQNTTGAVTVDSNGTLGLGDDNALNSTSITFKSGNLQAAGGARSCAAAINFSNVNMAISGSNDLTLKGPLNWGGSNILTVNNTGLTTFGGSFILRALADTTAQRTFTFAGPGTTRFNGPIVNGGTLNGIVDFNGTGTVELNANNSYSGATTIRAGQTVKLGNVNGLGFGGITSVAGATTVNSGGVLDLNGKGPVYEAITINGTGIGGTGVLVNNDTVNTAVIGNGIAQITPGASAGSYTSAPAVAVNNGGGATAAVSLGLIPASINVNTTTGTYSVAPTLTITGGGGSGATASVTIAGAVSIGNSGFGYTSAPTVTVTGGTLASGTAWTATGSGQFGATAIQVTNPGTGTTGTVSVSFDSGTATATANVSAVGLGSASSIGGPGNITINRPVTGGNALTKTGAGTLTLTGTCTYSGSSTINSGALVIGSGGVTGRLTATTGITNNASLTINRSDAVNQTGDLGTGAISGTGSLTQAGAGTITLTASNTYSGTTSVNAGTLLVTGSIIGATTSGAVSVASGATLGGNGNGTTTGVIGGAITINTGAILAPGPLIGTLTALGDTTFASTTTFAVDLDATTADRLNVAGTLDITGATLNVTQLAPAAATVYIIGSYGTLAGSQFAAVNGKPDGYNLDYNYQNNHQIALVLAASVTPYNTWALGPFAHALTDTAPGADPDGDGVSNLLEFVLGGDPTVDDSHAILASAVVSGSDLVVTFNRSDAAETAPAVTVMVQVSDDLGTWPAGNDIVIGAASDAGPIGGTNASYTVTENGGAPDTIVVTIPNGAATRRFVRIAAIQP